MSFLSIYLIIAAGIVISIVLPILRKSLPTPKPAGVGIWSIAKPYLAVGIFSLLTAVLILALVGDTLKDWRGAILAGYAWDSTLQKLNNLN
jgi:hypothetical protein